MCPYEAACGHYHTHECCKAPTHQSGEKDTTSRDEDGQRASTKTQNRFSALREEMDDEHAPRMPRRTYGGVCQGMQSTQNGNFATTANQSGSQTSKDQSAKTHQINFLESTCPSVNVVDAPEFTEFPVVLDSGAADHVVDNADTPGYVINESWGSKAGACFVAANGNVIANQGELKLEMRSGEETIHFTFQAADITKPLWSVSKICQAGYTVMFDKAHAIIYHVETGERVGVFPLRNGLYVGTMKLKNPTFARPDRR